MPKYDPNSPDTHAIVAKMEEYGGAFVKTLAFLFHRADNQNRLKIVTTWENYFDDYANDFGKENYFSSLPQKEQEEILALRKAGKHYVDTKVASSFIGYEKGREDEKNKSMAKILSLKTCDIDLDDEATKGNMEGYKLGKLRNSALNEAYYAIKETLDPSNPSPDIPYRCKYCGLNCPLMCKIMPCCGDCILQANLSENE